MVISSLFWRNKKSPLKLLKLHRFAEQLTTNVSINQDCIKSAKAEPFRYLIMIEHDTAAILNPEPCWDDALNVVLSVTSTSRIIANWYLEKVCCNLWFDSAKIQDQIWPPRPSLEYLLNYKIFSGFLREIKMLKTGCFFWLGAMQINFHIFQGSSISKSSIFGGWDKTIFERKSL